MTSEQLRQHLYRQPFEPFRVRLSDGRSYDIRYRDLNLVGESVFIIGIPEAGDPDPQFFDHTIWVPLKLIDGIDPLPNLAAPVAS
jgi:hypothetical protein